MFLLALAAQCTADDPACPFDQSKATTMIESVLRDELKDPDSAKFTWAAGYAQGKYKPVLGRSFSGWIVCGTVNAKNGYGGYTGPYAVIGVIGGDTVMAADMDQPNQYSPHAGWVADQCRKNGIPVL